jgi:hypothetical protein
MTKPMRPLLCSLLLATAACSNSAALLHPSDDAGPPSDDAGAGDGDGDDPSGDGDDPSGDGDSPSGDGDQPAGDGDQPAGDGDQPSGDGDGDGDDEPPTDEDASTSEPGSCEHHATYLPSKDEDRLEAGYFCDEVTICFADAEKAQAAAAAHPELSCGDGGQGDCEPERVCVMHVVHTLTADDMETFCSIFDAAEGSEEAVCMVFL